MELVNKYCVKHCLSFIQPLPYTHNHMQYDENFSCFQQIFVNKNILFFVIVIVQKFKSSECFHPFMFCVFVYYARYVCLWRDTYELRKCILFHLLTTAVMYISIGTLLLSVDKNVVDFLF